MTAHSTSVGVPSIVMGDWNKAAPRRCVNTVAPRGLADYEGVD